MGEVYRARDSKLDREVAIKVLPARLTSDPDALSRFEREAKAVAALSHPNILAIHDFGTEKNVTYAVTELLEGETLRGRLDGPPVTQKQAIDWCLQIAKGLSAAHGKGVVHRDLKPENVFVSADGHVKILDFGLAKRLDAGPDATSAPTGSGHTEPGTVMGTMGYMSPEQLRGLPVDHRSDIFSFGAILYELLSGRKAFKRDTASDTIAAILKEDPPELTQSGRSISPALDHIVRHCLEKDRENRFQTAKDVAFALSEASSPTAAVTGGVPTASVPGVSRKRAAIAAAVVIAVAAAGLLLWKRTRPTSPAPSAGPKRVAVLPFENLGSPEDDYFADGMADAVRAKLTSLSGLEVIARGSSVAYKKSAKTAEQIAKELDVAYLLTATVRWQKGGGTNRVQVTPELVQVSASKAPTSRWQQPFDSAITDVFQVQADIATKVAQALGTVLTATDAKELAKKPTDNLAAYDAYLKGTEAKNNFYYPEAKEAFERALALDPNFAMAMLGLAAVSEWDQAVALVNRATAQRDRLTDRERYAVDILKAVVDGKPDAKLRIAKELHQKYPADDIGTSTLYADALDRGDRDEAIRICQEALAVDPNNADFYNRIGYEYAYGGDYEKAVTYLSKYESLKSDSANPYDSFGEVQANFGRYDEAIRNLTRALAIKPDFEPAYRHLAVAYEGMGEYDKAIQSYEKAADLAVLEDMKGGALVDGIWAAEFGGRTEAARALNERFGKLHLSTTNTFTMFIPELVAAEEAYLDRRYGEAVSKLKALKPRLDAWFEGEKKAGSPEVSGSKPHFPRVNWMLAMALEKQGKTDEALAVWEANANPPNPFRGFEDRRFIMEARAKVAAIVARKGDLDRAEKLIAENHRWNPSWAPNRPSELVVEHLAGKKPH
jgi:serine/threonine protein kinase/tetratricopeptide (TPR) repeat protein